MIAGFGGFLGRKHDGHPVTPELAASGNPYTRKHIRRFGKYDLDMDDLPDPLDPAHLPFDLPL